MHGKLEDGRFTLEQDTNAYAILPSSQWRGYREPPEAPAPAIAAHGAIIRAACAIPMTEAVAEQRIRRQPGGGYPAA